MPYVVFRKRSEFEPEKFRFRKRCNLWDVRYKQFENKKSAAIYLQTPSLELCRFEEDKRNYYLICRVSNERARFWDLIQDLEMAIVEEMVADSDSWGFGDQAPVAYVETHFTPTLKMSSVNYDYSLHLKIPKGDEVFVFDQDRTLLDLSLLKEGYPVKLLLSLGGVALKNNSYSLKFIPQQIQTEVPKEVQNPPSEGECLISDSDENMSIYPEENSQKFSRLPREKIYHYSDDEQADLLEEEEEEKQQEQDYSGDKKKAQEVKHEQIKSVPFEQYQEDEHREDEQFEN